MYSIIYKDMQNIYQVAAGPAGLARRGGARAHVSLRHRQHFLRHLWMRSMEQHASLTRSSAIQENIYRNDSVA